MKNFSFVIALVLLLVLVACQPVMITAPAVGVDVAEQVQPSGPPTPFPMPDSQAEMWRQEVFEALLSTFVFPDPLPEGAGIQVDGTFSLSGPPSDWIRRDLAENCVIDITFPSAFTGTVSGTVSATKYQIYLKGPCLQGGPGKFDEVWQATGTFDGTVDGVAGAFEFLYLASVVGGGDDPGLLDAKFAVIPGTGTGGLTNLRGTLIAEDQLHGADTPPLTYSGALYLE